VEETVLGHPTGVKGKLLQGLEPPGKQMVNPRSQFESYVVLG